MIFAFPERDVRNEAQIDKILKISNFRGKELLHAILFRN